MHIFVCSLAFKAQEVGMTHMISCKTPVYGSFLKWGDPPNHPSSISRWIFHYKPSSYWVYPHFRKPPICKQKNVARTLAKTPRWIFVSPKALDRGRRSCKTQLPSRRRPGCNWDSNLSAVRGVRRSSLTKVGL